MHGGVNPRHSGRRGSEFCRSFQADDGSFDLSLASEVTLVSSWRRPWRDVWARRTQPNPYLGSPSIHLAHQSDLSRFLPLILLVDTNGVHPYREHLLICFFAFICSSTVPISRTAAVQFPQRNKCIPTVPRYRYLACPAISMPTAIITADYDGVIIGRGSPDIGKSREIRACGKVYGAEGAS